MRDDDDDAHSDIASPPWFPRNEPAGLQGHMFQTNGLQVSVRLYVLAFHPICCM